MSLKLTLKTGNGIIKTENGIIFPISCPDLKSINFFYKMFLNFFNEFKAGLETRKWNYSESKKHSILPTNLTKKFHSFLLLAGRGEQNNGTKFNRFASLKSK